MPTLRSEVGLILRGLASAKIPQPIVLYMGPSLNEKDFVCGGCGLATPGGKCAVLGMKTVDLKVGVCGIYVPGTPHEQDEISNVPKSVAGYVEEGPYTCGRCKHFLPPSTCEGVAGKIDAKGCCNAWEGK